MCEQTLGTTGHSGQAGSTVTVSLLKDHAAVTHHLGPECCCPEDQQCTQPVQGAVPLKPHTNPLLTEARDRS